jgi:hypothetical protein
VSRLQQILKVVDATKRKSQELENVTIYGKSDYWHYLLDSRFTNCENCKKFDGLDFYGDEIRSIFPDHLVVSGSLIRVHVHMTLWGKPTCKCKLIRVVLAPLKREVKLFDLTKISV